MNKSNLTNIDLDKLVDISQTIISGLEEISQNFSISKDTRDYIKDLKLIIEMKTAKLINKNLILF